MSEPREHWPYKVALPGPGAYAVYTCSCGEVRKGDLVEAGKAMNEHQDAGKWRSFMESVLKHEKVWILGRELQL